MGRYRGPKNRIARRFQTNIFGRKRNPMIHKNNPPGVHGARRKKKSDYGLQLEEKQKLKAAFGMISERQLVRYYKEATKKVGNTSHILLQLLECRLDVAVFRMRLAPTIFAAQQLVSHGHICVNGRRVDVRSFQVKPGMVVSVREKSRNIPVVAEAIAMTHRDIPSYLSVETDKFQGTLLTVPESDSIPTPIIIDVPVVCELLAHTK